MSSRIGAHLRSNVVGYIALFLVVTGGTAQALNGSNTVTSDDIVNKEVKTADIDTRAVTSNRLAANSVKSGNVIDDSLTGTDVAGLTGGDVTDDSLTGADVADLTGGDVTDDSLTGADVASLTGSDINDASLTSRDVAGDTLTGAEIDESTLGQVPSATLGGVVRSQTEGGYCNPEGTGFATCAYTTVGLPARTRVLVIGGIRGTSEENADSGFGDCRLAASGGSSPDYLGRSYRAAVVDSNNSVDWLPLSTVVAGRGPGYTDFGVECNETYGGIQYDFMTVSAVALSPG
jgi:hypothetical protein